MRGGIGLISSVAARAPRRIGTAGVPLSAGTGQGRRKILSAKATHKIYAFLKQSKTACLPTNKNGGFLPLAFFAPYSVRRTKLLIQGYLEPIEVILS
ncbi:MAG: hypothetical protein DRP74_03625 [Candidatus Omnitrophota bacterium]|nr:MAG: hypothetical protein DRP74_03625 [Candidatus Omnitrophota bacterium]